MNSWSAGLFGNSELVLGNDWLRVKWLTDAKLVDGLNAELVFVSRQQLVGSPRDALRAVSQWCPADTRSLTLEDSVTHKSGTAIVLWSSPSESNLSGGDLGDLKWASWLIWSVHNMDAELV